MGALLPALSLAMVHIAGDNVGVVPDSATIYGPDIYVIIIISYFILGTIFTALSAWIGTCGGCELGVLVRRKYGRGGKKILAAATLAVSIPASAVTGGYFAGWVIYNITGISHPIAMLICLLVFTILATGYCEGALLVANYGALVLVPVVLLIFFLEGCPVGSPVLSAHHIDWMLVFALFGYNAGGMRPLMVTEAAAYLTQRGRNAVWQAVVAKLVEGVLTLVMAKLILTAGIQGPLAISGLVERWVGVKGGVVFGGILLCMFTNTMVPAMMANARQIASLTGLKLLPALTVAGFSVYLMTFIDYQGILHIISVTGILMGGLLLYIACHVHKRSDIGG